MKKSTKEVEPIVVKPCGTAPGTQIISKGSPEVAIMGLGIIIILWSLFIIYLLKF